MLERAQRGVFYFGLRPLARVMSRPVIWACRHWTGIPAHIRVRELYKHSALLRPYYFRGIECAFQYSTKLGLNSFSILEFGVAEGNGILYLQTLVKALREHPKYQRKKIKIIGYDTFTGLPPIGTASDGHSTWKTGDYPGDLETLRAHIDPQLIHLEKGLFSEGIERTENVLRDYPPLFVIVDCDLYSSTQSIFEGLFPEYVPPLSYWFFDDANLNFYSKRVGERLAIQEFCARPQNPYEFIPDYAALDSPLPHATALMHCYHCVHNNEYIDLTMTQAEPKRLTLDVQKYTTL